MDSGRCWFSVSGRRAAEIIPIIEQTPKAMYGTLASVRPFKYNNI
jgi:hypothetical protein